MQYLLLLLIVAIPLAVAAQNAVLALVGTVLLTKIFYEKNWSRAIQVLRYFRLPIAAALLFLVSLTIASIFNEQGAPPRPGKFIAGYGAWFLLSFLIVANLKSFSSATAQKVYSVFAVVIFIAGLIGLSQLMFGWRIQGVEFVEDARRARGFYSHPLTYAYVGLILYGFTLGVMTTTKYTWRSILAFVGSVAIIVSSLSKMAILSVAVVTTVLALVKLKNRGRMVFGMGLVAAITLVSVTENPISTRFARWKVKKDVQSEHLDDRVVFWQVHLEMFKERPLFGHGTETGTGYRTPYYERLGFGAFEKKYEAHNTFLQVFVNGGIVGGVLFLIWLGFHFRKSFQHRWHPDMAGGFYSLVLFALASLTQNSFQDSEVRYILALIAALICFRSFELETGVKEVQENLTTGHEPKPL